jgi:hypothetical protein
MTKKKYIFYWCGFAKCPHKFPLSPGHTPKGGFGVLVCVGAQWPWWGELSTGRGDGDEALSFLLNKI